MKFLSFFFSPFRGKERREMRQAVNVVTPFLPPAETWKLTDRSRIAVLFLTLPPECSAKLFSGLTPEQVQAVTLEITQLPSLSEASRVQLLKEALSQLGRHHCGSDLKELTRLVELEAHENRSRLLQYMDGMLQNCPTIPSRIRFMSDHQKVALLELCLPFWVRSSVHIQQTDEQRIYIHVASENVLFESILTKVEVLREFLGLDAEVCLSLDCEYKALRDALVKLAKSCPEVIVQTYHRIWPNWSMDPRILAERNCVPISLPQSRLSFNQA